MLQGLYNNGIYHGGISAINLRLADDYTLKLPDFEISLFNKRYSQMDEEKKLSLKVNQLGYNSKTASESIKNLKDSIEFRELIAEDWRDFVAAFYFPTTSKVMTNTKITEFISRTNTELLKSRSNPDVINTLVR